MRYAESHCTSCKCQACLFCPRRPQSQPLPANTLCADAFAGCTSYLPALGCAGAVRDIPRLVPFYVRKWYAEPLAGGSATTMREVCCRSCLDEASFAALPASESVLDRLAGTSRARASPSAQAHPVAFVMPLHRPKFYLGLRFAESFFVCSQQRGFRFHPVFASFTDNASFLAQLHSRLGRPHTWWASGVVVQPDPRNPVTSKKLAALHHIFTTTEARYAVAVDAETEFQSPWSNGWPEWFARWSRQRRAVGFDYRGDPLEALWSNISSLSCAVVGLGQSRRLLYWWSDAPVYERADYGDFWGRLRWERLSWYVFEHEAYMCYKVAVARWGVISTREQLEKRGAAAQRAQVPPSEYSFLWSRDVPSLADGPRLLRFHLDRNLSSPTEGFVSPSQRPGDPCRTASGARDQVQTPRAAGMRRQGEPLACASVRRASRQPNVVNVSWRRRDDARRRSSRWLGRLGMVESDDGRWAEYLRSVYGDKLQLPFDLRTLRWFWWWAPGAARLERTELPVWRRAQPGDVWVPGLWLERHLASGGFFVVPPHPSRRVAAGRLLQSTAGLTRQRGRSKPLEVIRVAHPSADEASTFGAEAESTGQVWYWAAPGSGIVWDPGRLLRVPNRSALIARLAARLPGGSVPLRLQTVDVPHSTARKLCGDCAPEAWASFGMLHGPAPLCDSIRRAGFDSLQFTSAFGGQRTELVDCRDNSHGPSKKARRPLASVCPPAPNRLRSASLGASQSSPTCKCSPERVYLNCAPCSGRAPPIRVRYVTDRAGVDVGVVGVGGREGGSGLQAGTVARSAAHSRRAARGVSAAAYAAGSTNRSRHHSSHSSHSRGSRGSRGGRGSRGSRGGFGGGRGGAEGAGGGECSAGQWRIGD